MKITETQKDNETALLFIEFNDLISGDFCALTVDKG